MKKIFLIIMAVLITKMVVAQTDTVSIPKPEKPVEDSVKIAKNDEVTIFGFKKQFIQFDGNKTIIQVSDNDMLDTGSIKDAIPKLPGVLQIMPGQTQLNGKPTAIWIDGEDTGLAGSNLSDYLATIPANMVEKVELIPNPGAEFDASKDGGIINIITKQTYKKGMNGVATLGGKWREGGYLSTYPNVALNIRQNKWNFNINLGYNYDESFTQTRYASHILIYNPIQSIIQNQDIELYNRNYYNRLGVQYRLDEKTTFSLNYNFNTSNDNHYLNGQSFSENLATDFNYDSRGKDKIKTNRNEWILRAKRKFDDKSVLQFSNNFNTYHQDDDNRYASPEISLYSLRNTRLRNTNYTANLSFEKPFDSLQIRWKSGVKYVNNYTKNSGNYKNSINNQTFTDYNTIDYHYNSNTFAAYTEFTKKWTKNLSSTLGIRYEYVDMGNHSEQDLYADYRYSDHFGNWFPSVNLSYDIKKMLTLSLGYNKKIALPDYNELDPNVSGFSNNLFANSGTSALLPVKTDNFNASLSVQGYPLLSYDYTYAKDNYFNFSDVDTSTGQTITKYTSLHNLKTQTVTMILPVPVDKLIKPKGESKNVDGMNLIGFFGYYTHNQFDTDVSAIAEYHHVWAYGGFAQLTLPYKINFSGFLVLTPNHGSFQTFNLNNKFHESSFSLSRKFMNKKLEVEMYLNSPFDNDRNVNINTLTPNFKTDIHQYGSNRAFGINLKYTFGTKGREEQSQQDSSIEKNVNPLEKMIKN